jgi:cell division protein ZipA
VVVGVYLWTKGVFGRRFLPQSRRERAARTEPSFAADGPAPVAREPSPAPAAEAPPAARPSRAPPDRIITLRLIPRGDELSAERAVGALADAGLKHGRYGIFHLHGLNGEPAFSCASLTEPGTFDLASLGHSTIAGLSFFIVLPGAGDPVSRFDAMVETARALTVELEADLHDEAGSSWSVQRERYLREEIIEYRHQLERR